MDLRQQIILSIRALLLSLVMTCLAQAPIAAAKAPPDIEAAIEHAVMVLLGGAETVRVESLHSPEVDAMDVVAVPDAAARVGKPSRFVLWSGGRRIGVASATVHVRASYVSAARVIPRGASLTEADLAVVLDELGPVPMRLLPSLEQVISRRARRQIAPGEAITTAVIVAPPAVRSGETVEVTLRVGLVEVRTVGVVSGSGGIGDLVGVLRSGSKRLIRARVIGRGAVEVIE